MKKNKTCAAYVCAFLLLAIVLTTVVLTRETELSEDAGKEDSIEQTKVEVPDQAEKIVQHAELSDEEKDVKPEENQARKTEPELKVETKLTEPEPSETEELALPKEYVKEEKVSTEKPQKTGVSEISVQQKLVEEIYNTAALSSKNGSIYISYEQPEIPPDYHLTVKAEVYDKNGKTYCRYVSDAGWLNESSNYDASAKKVLEKLGAGNLEDKMYILVVKVGDGDLLVGATVWQLTHNYDGTTDLVKTYID